MLDQQGIPHLPVRLDKRLPRDNTRAFGEALALPESPVRCLKAIAGDRGAVLILDQLDALRWTPQHDPSAWLVFEQLVNESLRLSDNMHVIVACRTFDLQHDPNISAWRKEGERSQLIEDLPVGDLAVEVARRVVEGRGASWESLTGRQKDLLRKPHHLYLWAQLPAGPRVRSVFRSATDLMRAFWQHAYERLAEASLDSRDVEEALSTLVNRLDEDGLLTAPSAVLDKWPKVRDVLCSLAVDRSKQHQRPVHPSELLRLSLGSALARSPSPREEDHPRVAHRDG